MSAAPDSSARPIAHDPRPIIHCTPNIHVMRDLACAALAGGTCEIYQRGAELTRIVRAPGDERGRIKRRPESPFLRSLDLASLKPILSASARWERWNEKAQEWRHTKPDVDACAALLREGSWRGIRVLEEAAKAGWHGPSVLITGDPNLELGPRHGGTVILRKPFHITDFQKLCAGLLTSGSSVEPRKYPLGGKTLS